MEELFKKSQALQKQSAELEEEYYKNAHKIKTEKEAIINKIKELKLNELGINIGDKVIDTNSNDVAFLVGLNFRQKPHTYIKDRNKITFDDFEFKGEYKDIKKDGTISKKEPIMALNFYSLKRFETAKEKYEGK